MTDNDTKGRLYSRDVPQSSNVQLFAVYLGGDPAPGRLGEDHEVVLVVASDVREARKASKAKWTGLGRPHVDGVKLLRVVDGFRVILEPTDEAESNVIDTTYEPSDETSLA